MTIAYSSSLRLIKPGAGDLVGTWGDAVNSGLTDLLDTALAGTTTITLTTSDVTLSTANGAADQARAMRVALAGTPGATRVVYCPAVPKLYVVYNGTSNAQTFATSGGGATVSVPAGKSVIVYCTGTSIVGVITSLADLSISGGTF